MDKLPRNILPFFWSKVLIPENRSECWIWTGPSDVGAYGRFCTGTQNIKAHRVAYCEIVGPIPEEQMIRHLCHNKLCVNPNHLAVGSAQDNADDTKARNLGPAKLTRDQVIYIRQNPLGMKGVELAKQFGVSKSLISEIKNMRHWVPGSASMVE